MISDRFIEYLQNNVVTYTLGTRDSELQPSVAKPMALFVSDDRKKLTICVPDVAIDGHLDNLKANGNVSLTVSAIPSHESYQFKGKYMSDDACDADQIAQANEWKVKFSEACGQMGFPQPVLEGIRSVVADPATAITFEVTEIYEQSPKPGTGNKISE